MKLKFAALGGAAAALTLVISVSVPAYAASGYQTCSATQSYGIQSELAAGATSTTLTVHTYVSSDSRVYYGTGIKNSRNAGDLSSGPWSTYSPYSLKFSTGNCGPKIS